MGSIPGSGRSPGEGNGNLLQHSCLENPTDRGAWWAAKKPMGSQRIDRATKRADARTHTHTHTATKHRVTKEKCFLSWHTQKRVPGSRLAHTKCLLSESCLTRVRWAHSTVSCPLLGLLASPLSGRILNVWKAWRQVP